MKKLIFILALLLMAAPAWSQVTIDVNATDTWNDEDDPNRSWAYLQFKYEADLEDELVRAFALEISVSGPNGVIDWIWSENGAYEVAPGGVDGIVAEFGEEDTDPWITEQASLYNLDEEDGIQPDSNGLLFGIEVIGDQGTSICVDVELNAIRGGIVMEDATAPDGAITADPCCVALAEKEEELCYAGQPDFDEWESVGSPDSWCNPRQCHGDADGIENSYGRGQSAWVSTEDVAILTKGYRQEYSGDPSVDGTDPDSDPDTWIAADFDHINNSYGRGQSARVSTEDVSILTAHYRNEDPTPTDPNCLD